MQYEQEIPTMCFKIYHIYKACAHAADKFANGLILAVVKPCSKALYDQEINTKLVLCEELEIRPEVLSGLCEACILDPTVFTTRQYKDHMGRSKLRKPGEQEMAASRALRNKKTKKLSQQTWDSFDVESSTDRPSDPRVPDELPRETTPENEGHFQHVDPRIGTKSEVPDVLKGVEESHEI